MPRNSPFESACDESDESELPPRTAGALWGVHGMTLRTVVSIAALMLVALVAAGIAVGVYLVGEPVPPASPGNYVVLAGSSCELRVVRTPPAASFTLRPTRCTPLTPGLDLSDGLTADTVECGVLTFTLSPIGADLDAFACSNCGQGHTGACPLSSLPAGGALRWERID